MNVSQGEKYFTRELEKKLNKQILENLNLKEKNKFLSDNIDELKEKLNENTIDNMVLKIKYELIEEILKNKTLIDNNQFSNLIKMLDNDLKKKKIENTILKEKNILLQIENTQKKNSELILLNLQNKILLGVIGILIILLSLQFYEKKLNN